MGKQGQYYSAERLAKIVKQAKDEAARQAREDAYTELAAMVDRRVYQALRNNKPGEAVQLVQVLDYMSDRLGQSIPF